VANQFFDVASLSWELIETSKSANSGNESDSFKTKTYALLRTAGYLRSHHGAGRF
jgi:hypothetical protein